MNKRQLIKDIFRSKLLFLSFSVAIIAGVVAVSALRDNYSKMVELRSAVAVADEQNGDVEQALQNLREHVHGHMNTDLTSGPNAISPPIQLKYRYDRLMAAEGDQVKAKNAEIAARGEAICSSRFPASGFNSARVSCVTDYVSANAISESPVAEDLYKFDFVSPRWSPDLAGFSLLVSVLSGLVFTIGVLIKIIKRRLNDAPFYG